MTSVRIGLLEARVAECYWPPGGPGQLLRTAELNSARGTRQDSRKFRRSTTENDGGARPGELPTRRLEDLPVTSRRPSCESSGTSWGRSGSCSRAGPRL